MTTIHLSPLHKAVRDHLRDAYGVGQIEFFGGGNHDRAEFTYRNKRCVLTLRRAPGGREVGASTIEMKLRDVRKLLGDPPSLLDDRPRRTLEDMTVELNAKAPSSDQPVAPMGTPLATPRTLSATGSVALRASNKCLTFIVPPKIRERFVASGGETTHVEFHGPDAWTIRHGAGPRMRPNSNGGMAIGGKRYIEFFGGFFPRRPATFTLDALGEIRVKLDEPVTTLAPAKVIVEPVAPPKPPEPARDLEPDGAHPHPVKPQFTLPDPTNLRAILELIAEAEAGTVYRLVRLKEGGMAWQAPLIKLEDEA